MWLAGPLLIGAGLSLACAGAWLQLAHVAAAALLALLSGSLELLGRRQPVADIQAAQQEQEQQDTWLQQERVQAWCASTAAAAAAGNGSGGGERCCFSPTSCFSWGSLQQQQGGQNSSDAAHASACATAAAAAAAVMTAASLPLDQAAVAVGAAAVLATQLARGSEPSSICTPQRASSGGGCHVPPIDYEASEEQLRELEAAAPPELLCPLGRVLMTDPVFSPSGFTYHRPCIHDFIARTGRDPAREAEPLAPEQLVSNLNMRDQVATWLQRRGIPT